MALKPSGPHLIQLLSSIYIHESAAMTGSFDWPGPDFVYDPSNGGPPSSWGTIILGTDGGGNPISGQTLGTRDPGGPDGGLPKRRKGGSGNPPYKNTLTHQDSTLPKSCFAGSIRVVITNPPPDPFGWNGQQPTFTTTQGTCLPYSPPIVNGPSTALSIGSPPLIQQVKNFLTTNVGPNSFATVLTDSVQGPGSACSSSATCPGFSAQSYPGNSVGFKITPA